MSKKIQTVVSEMVVAYVCNCPKCGETIYSEYQSDWDIQEMIDYDSLIVCEECKTEFYVSAP